MKKTALALVLVLVYLDGNAQLYARVKPIETINGLCDDKNIYRFFSTQNDQKNATPPISKIVLVEKLNADVVFLKDSAALNAKVWVTTFISCSGVLVNCKVQSTNKSTELADQITKVFTTLGVWSPGQFKGKNVDTSLLWQMEIINGKFYLKPEKRPLLL